MLCPFVKDECVEEECALWNFHNGQCAINLIGESVGYMDENGLRVKVQTNCGDEKNDWIFYSNESSDSNPPGT